MNFLEKMQENAVAYQDKILLADDTTKGVTYGQLDNLAGRVYRYLKNKGIGKEDFVMICLPRGIQPLIALYGVWKAGAAFVLVEDNYAPERIAFIRSDCGCKLVIDHDIWAEIQTLDPLPGFEPFDENAAAFAVYTSGTTGNPKGVLHEYGNLHRMVDSVTMRSCDPLASTEDRFALVAPLNFVASMLITVYAFYFVVTLYVVPYSVVKNPMQIAMFIVKNKITGTFLTPSHLRTMKSKPPMLNFCIIGSEPANDVYVDGLTIHNFYLMSESGFAVTHFKIDKRYESTPVGNSECGYNIMLLGEDGKEVADGEEGEVCFENPHVRGYINLPDQTAEAFKNGIYHTGDLAKKDAEGRIVICGRLNDMVKINGNRVEPGEIEGVAKKVLGVDWAAARIFDDGRRVFICCYYLKDMKVDTEATRKKMEEYLPYYMLPSFFIHIDEVPLKATGKMDRKALPKPVLTDYMAEYVAPRDDVETALCTAFAKALDMQRVGIKDDFYELGGDSIHAMQILEDSGLPGLTMTDIFRGHTPEKTAELYKEHRSSDDGADDERNQEAMQRPHPLTTEQLYMVDYQLYTPMSTMYNLFQMLRFDKEQVDMHRLAEAFGKVLQNHPAVLTTFRFNLDGEMEQVYTPEVFKPIEVEKITEAELKLRKDDLVQPFKIVNSPLYRVHVFETEEAGYLFFDVHHTLFDGTSFKVLMSDFANAYMEQPLEPDYYYLLLQKREDAQSSDFYLESKKYFEGKYDGTEWQCFPNTDHETRSNEFGEMETALDISPAEMSVIDEKLHISRNEFFLTVGTLATALYNKSSNVKLSWIYNGREDQNSMQSIGLLFRNLPIALKLRDDRTVFDIYKDVKDQVKGAIEHSCYPYVESTANIAVGDLACILYQRDLRDVAVEGLELETVEIRQNKPASQTVLDMEILDGSDGLAIMFDYAASRYERSSMEKFHALFTKVAKQLLAHPDEKYSVAMLKKDLIGKKTFMQRFASFFKRK